MANVLKQVQQGSANAGGAATATLAFTTQNTTPGSLLFAALQVFPQTRVLSSVTDDQGGNTWVVLPGINVPGGNYTEYFCYALNTAGGTKPTVTFHFTGGNTTNVYPTLGEISGPTTFRAQDAGNTGSTTTPVSAAVAALAGDLLISNLGIAGSEAIVSLIAGSGYTLGSTAGVDATHFQTAWEYNLNAAGGSTTAGYTILATNWAANIAAFFTQTAATPTFSPNGGAFGPAQTVAISSTTPGGTIFYTTDGSTPTHSSSSISNGGTVSISVTSVLKAIETAAGFADSAVGSASFTINGAVGTPTFNPVAGTYGSTQNVTITSANSTTITYTTDGSTPIPGSHGTVYSGPVAVASSLTIKAIGSAVNWSNSAEGDAAYVISGGSGGSGGCGLLKLLGVN